MARAGTRDRPARPACHVSLDAAARARPAGQGRFAQCLEQFGLQIHPDRPHDAMAQRRRCYAGQRIGRNFDRAHDIDDLGDRDRFRIAAPGDSRLWGRAGRSARPRSRLQHLFEIALGNALALVIAEARTAAISL